MARHCQGNSNGGGSNGQRKADQRPGQASHERLQLVGALLLVVEATVDPTLPAAEINGGLLEAHALLRQTFIGHRRLSSCGPPGSVLRRSGTATASRRRPSSPRPCC